MKERPSDFGFTADFDLDNPYVIPTSQEELAKEEAKATEKAMSVDEFRVSDEKKLKRKWAKKIHSETNKELEKKKNEE